MSILPTSILPTSILPTSILPTQNVDLADVQGDIILGLPKRVEHFVFFVIGSDQVASFKRVVGGQDFSSMITTTAQIQTFRAQIVAQKAQSQGTLPLIPFAAVNIAFTNSGLRMLGLTDDIGDLAFKEGQLARAQILGDNGTFHNGIFDPAWRSEFKGDIHGIILIAGESDSSVQNTENKIFSLLGSTVKQVLNVSGNARPGVEKGHEHFGYMDGISSPAVKNIVNPLPGQQVIDPGVLLMGQPGDPLALIRPAWTKNGSILVYRHLDQLVPEFDEFKRQNALFPLDLGIEKGADLLGARFFGRWKSGAPTDITPLQDDPVLAADPQRNNNFDFSKPTDQTSCPFAAHIRKTNPRSDLPNPAVAIHSINRSGLPFGPEVTDSERNNKKTENERGLAFVCYQSILGNGFEFMQMTWANNENFIFGKFVNGLPFQPGFDPIIGQNGGNPAGRSMGGFNPKAQANRVNVPDFVISKGGAYFFSPSISTLKTKIGTPS